MSSAAQEVNTWILKSAGTVVATALLYVLVAAWGPGSAYRAGKLPGISTPSVGVAKLGSSAAATTPRWTSLQPDIAWAERLFVLTALPWIVLMVGIVATGAYEHFGSFHYNVVGVALVTPSLLIPALTQPAYECAKPLLERYWVKAHVWVAILVYVGSYFWTHYFYSLLGATYTFTATRLNDVPISMFLAAHAYFMLYHAMTNMALRRWYTSHTYARLPSGFGRRVGTGLLVLLMAWLTAFMETFTISAFPYYHIANREYMYTVGSIVYGLYFIVSFPMFYRMGSYADSDGVPPPARASEDAKPFTADPWSMVNVAVHSLGGSMLVTIMLDLWRITYFTATNDTKAANPPPFMAPVA